MRTPVFGARGSRVSIVFLALQALLTVPDPGGAAHALTIPIAIEGDAAPGGNGTFEFFGLPRHNDAGQVAFLSILTGTAGGASDDTGHYRGSGGAVTQIAREGQAAPVNGNLGNLSQSGSYNEGGEIAFFSVLTGTPGGAADDTGIFRGAGGPLTQIVREGQMAPFNGTFAGLGSNTFLNDVNQVAFNSTLLGTPGGVLDDTGIFRGSGAAITQIVREGQVAPVSGTFSSFGTQGLNDLGETAFTATLIGTAGGATDDFGIFRGAGAAITQIAREGQPPPDASGTLSSLLGVRLNASGQVAFRATLLGTVNDLGIFRGSGGALTQIAREGQASPDGNGTLSFLNDPLLNDAGQAAFSATLVGTAGGTSDNEGIFRGSGAALSQLAREGQLAPGGNGAFSTFFADSLNNVGVTAFRSNLLGTVGGSSDDGGLFLADPTEIVEVAREGQPLAGSTIQFMASAGLVNELGQVAYAAQLVDARVAILRFTPDLHWRAVGSGSWDTAPNWTLGIDPAGIHSVFVDPGTGLTVTGPTGNTSIDSLTIGARLSGTAALRTMDPASTSRTPSE